MVKLVKASTGAHEVQINGGALYKSGKDGVFEVSNGADQKAMLASGCFPASNQPITSKHFVCQVCGFDALIRHCPKCDRDDCLLKMYGTEPAEEAPDLPLSNEEADDRVHTPKLNPRRYES